MQLWADGFWATGLWADDFWSGLEAAIAEAFDGMPQRVRRVKEKPIEVIEDNLREILEKAARIERLVEAVDTTLSVAEQEAREVPIRLLSGKHARAQVQQLKAVTVDVKTHVGTLEANSVAPAQLQAIDGKVDRIIELSVTKPIATAAKSVKELIAEVSTGI